MNEMVNYIFRHMRIDENNIRYLKNRTDVLYKNDILFLLTSAVTVAILAIQDKQIKNLEKEVAELKSKGE